MICNGIKLCTIPTKCISQKCKFTIWSVKEYQVPHCSSNNLHSHPNPPSIANQPETWKPQEFPSTKCSFNLYVRKAFEPAPKVQNLIAYTATATQTVLSQIKLPTKIPSSNCFCLLWSTPFTPLLLPFKKSV